VALIQVARSADDAALVDPLALEPEELAPLWDVMTNPHVVKIMHSARNDVGELSRDFGLRPYNVFDTQLAAQFLGYERFSLDALLQMTADIALEKKYQRYDWARRPIPEGPRDYAVQDVIHLFALRTRLIGELLDRDLQRAYGETVRHHVALSEYEETPFDPRRWKRLSGARTLDETGKSVAAALYSYRHELCVELNRAALHVMDNRSLVELARVRPRSARELQNVKLHGRTKERRGKEILRVIADAIDTPFVADAPKSAKRDKQLRGSARDRFQRLLELRRELAEELDISAEFIVSRAAMTAIANDHPTDVEALADCEDVLPWQVELVGARLLDVL
jgi:ribonuclease D